jgi:esterase/lipase
MQVASTSFRGYAIDLAGYGDSARQIDSYSLDQQVQLVESFRETFGYDKIAIVGHGLGAIVAMMFAERYPSTVDRVMAIGLPLSKKELPPRLSTLSIDELVDLLQSRSPFNDLLQKDSQKIDANALHVSLDELQHLELDKLVKSSIVPSLLLYGALDPLITLPTQSELSVFNANMAHISFAESGHYPMLDETTKFNRLLVDFFSLLSGESPRKLHLKTEWALGVIVEKVSGSKFSIRKEENREKASAYKGENRSGQTRPTFSELALEQPVEIDHLDVSQITPPSRMLYIAYERFHEKAALIFTLFRRGEVGQTFEPVSFEGDLYNYANHFYDRLTKLTDMLDPTTNVVLGKQRTLLAEDIDRRVKNLGQNLWKELIPDKLKEIYYQELARWHDQTLLIVSDEPYLPWELIWPYGNDWEDPGPWCETTLFTRWLRRDSQGNGHESPANYLTMQSLICLAPKDSGLRAAQDEYKYLSKIAKENNIENISPDPQSWSSVLDLLEKSDYGWIHVAAHGNFYPESPDSDSAIWLQDGHPFTPQDVVGPGIEKHIKIKRPAFVFNACHAGRQGWTLTRLGGWANRLISNGAGLFLGPLWTVTDERALLFSETFYQQLFQNHTVAEAVREARLSIKKSGDPTWLSYSIYAHPNARLKNNKR